jgi:hypothetical protein
MKSVAALLAFAGLWFFALICFGFFARAMFELASLGWNLWP